MADSYVSQRSHIIPEKDTLAQTSDSWNQLLLPYVAPERSEWFQTGMRASRVTEGCHASVESMSWTEDTIDCLS